MASKLEVDVQVIVTCPSCGSRSLLAEYYVTVYKDSLEEEQPMLSGDFKCCYCNYQEYISEDI
jgi:hypothetical protein